MREGIREWQGLTADGPPEAGIAYFEAGSVPADMAALAWALEENTRLFYTRLAGMRSGSDEAVIFLKLAEAEEHHKDMLASIHYGLSEEPLERFHADQEPPVLEGGALMGETLKWAGGKAVKEILAASMGFEANAYDRYLRMAGVSKDGTAKEIFLSIAREEKGHLKRLGELLDSGSGEAS